MRLAAIALFFACANLAFAADCPNWAAAEKKLKLHGYTIKKLSPAGVQRATSYLSIETPQQLTGYLAWTRFYRFIQDGQPIGGRRDDRAIIMLTSPNGDCRAQAGGTIKQMTSILDGSAEHLSDALAK